MHQFNQQGSADWLTSAFIYTVGAVAVVLVVAGLLFVDKGLVRRRNVLDTTIQKIGAAMIAGLGTLLIGYPIWQWQFNQAFGVPSPLWQAIKDWWLGGDLTTTASRYIDPKVLPEADVQQIFLVFFITFSMAVMALVHTGVVERIKPVPLYVMSFFMGAVISPLVAYFCWGSLSPLTLHGTHDFDGVFPLYITAGTFVAVLSWRVGPRLGAFRPHASGVKPASHNAAFVGAGVLLILFALPFVTIGSGYLVPNDGFYGISFTKSGLGLTITDVFAAVIGGSVVGLFLAYRRREHAWALLGPLAGVVMCGTLFDIGNAWECLIVGGLGPFVAIGTAVLLRRLGIDDPKVVPLALGPGIVGALLCGFIEWGTRTGGYIGLTGKWTVGVGTITPWWQLAGIAVTVLVSGVPALILCLVFERFGGLRVSEETELLGLDVTQWGVTNFGDDLEGAALPRVPGQPNAGSAPLDSGRVVADEEGVPA